MAPNDALPAVLVVNDDGIEAAGIKALVSVLGSAGFCRVFVCAPDVEKSACAQSITIRETLEANLVEDYEGAAVAYSLTGTPADCASMGLSGQLFKGVKPLLVISGINKGANTGRQVIYSGTVAGAREAVIQGVPGISISLDWAESSTDAHFSPAAATCLPLIRCVLEAAASGQLSSSGGDRLLLNMNVPVDPSKSKGFKLAQQGQARVAFPWTHIAKKRTGVQLAGIGGAGGGGRGLPGMMGGRGLPGMVGGRGLPGMAGGRGLPGMTGPSPVSLAQLGSVASAAGAARCKIPGEEGKEGDGEEPWQPLHKMHFRHEPSGWDVLDKDPAFDSAALALGYVTVTPLAISTSINVQPQLKSDLAWLAPLLPNDA
ncbi:hypothetical protein CLOM_g17239 [Closterium sp. NIES-68]|nr:hypothetical protein CLOM_g17239 [Closterium sp. NIES-68]GJP79312.1 hypothetical protein CLOP_g9557 [Closterium sp. NIES-67]